MECNEFFVLNPSEHENQIISYLSKNVAWVVVIGGYGSLGHGNDIPEIHQA